MIRLRKILLCRYPYFLFLFFTIFIVWIRINNHQESIYSQNTKNIEGVIGKLDIDGNKLDIILKAKENVIATYYSQTKKEKKRISHLLKLGDQIVIQGEFREVKENKTKGLFDYKNYLKRQNIHYLICINEIKIKKHNQNIFYKVKQWVINRCKNSYVRTFILGDTTKLDSIILSQYRDLGISHLLAISGMHISLLTSILLFLFAKIKIKQEKRYILVGVFLIFYLFITGISPSILRAILFFIFFSINKIKYFYIKPIHLFILVLCLSLIINPYSIYDISFQYSYSISLSLLLLSEYINKFNHYLSKLFITSLISFVVSLPITLYQFNQINLLSIFYNLFYIPLISIFIFPLSIIIFIFPKLEIILTIFISILEFTSKIFNQIRISKIIFKEINFIFYFLYYLLIIFFFIGLIKKKYKYIIPLLGVCMLHYLIPQLEKKNYIFMIDVGQGDSILIHSKGKNVLIDTGGILSYSKKEWQKKANNYSLVKNITIPLLKKRGIKQIDYLILTHGDYDHLGETINLIHDFKVKKILINANKVNSLEKKIIEEFSHIEKIDKGYTFNIGDATFLQLNTNLEEENDSSLVFYVSIGKRKILLMGDASIKSEEYIMKNYNLGNIDILKSGHHGSRTSSSEEFIKKTNPKLALISAGMDNQFNHPHKEVLDLYKKYQVQYLITYNEGSIQIDLDH